MAERHPFRHRLVREAQSRQIGPQRRIERDLALLYQTHNQGAHKRLGDGADLKQCWWASTGRGWSTWVTPKP